MESLNSKIIELIKERNWNKMTDIQKKSLKPILSGNNTLIIAPTGYGKTEAALLPVLSQMIESNAKPVSLIYITPLKALINDITFRVDWWASRLDFLVSRKHGEVPQKEKNMRLKKVPHILITTPEGLEIDLDWASRFREFYKNVKWVIVDEIHELVNSKRGIQLSILLERLKEFSNFDFQRIGLSATVANEDLISSFLFGSSSRNPSIVRISDSKNFELRIKKICGNDIWTNSAKEISSSIESPSLIFTNSRFLTERLHEELEKLNQEGIFVHHSSISRESKNNVEEHLRAGKAKAVICTKTLELGIDVGDIRKIIMYRPPPSVASFLQRLGRSGHCISGVPKGEIFCIYDFDVLEALSIYYLAKKGIVEKPGISSSLDVAAREILGITLQYEKVSPEFIYNVLINSYPFRNLKKEKFEEIINYLIRNGLLSLEGEDIKIGKFFFKLWNFNRNRNFSWTKSFSEFFSLINNDDTFILKHNDRIIGEIDAIYVYKHIRIGDIIRISGKLWKVIKIHSGRMSIEVVPTDSGEGEIPVWKGDGIPKSYLLPKEISKLIRNIDKINHNILDKNAVMEINDLLSVYLNHKIPLPSNKIIIIEKRDKETVYTTLLNERISNTISHMLLYLATSKESLNTYARSSIYGFSVSYTEKDLLKDILKLSDKKLKQLILKSVLRSPLFISVLKEIQISFGKVGKVNNKEDKILIKEALKQTVNRYFSIKGTLKFIRKIKNNEIKIINYDGITPLGDAVLSHAPIKPWLFSVYTLIYESLKGGAYTISELSETLGISEKSLENKLKQMRKPDSKFRITSFIDVDSREIRWCLLDDLEKIVESDDFYTSFSVLNENETFVAVLRQLNGNENTEIIFKPKELIDNFDEIKHRIPFEEIGELRISDPVDPLVCNLSPRFYYVNKKSIPYLLLNAVAYIQNLKYS
ncbi:DEAD/DEAH box helicase [Acidianus brierleyi]|uniref:ATP-dependent helicase n=1 Tax=Acidianus brierleyi TaxID=41673 RepID=A0A2U9IG60_9CREN|nr:DEAD/DEAH box helicase [Acidianus brierleyi]AWR95028.1 DEAD/DEAH box helicase [Acidianus brierleyi]